MQNKLEQPRIRSPLILLAVTLAIYIAWVAATYLLEGRVNLLQRTDPVGRMTYAVIANIVIGTILSAITIRSLIKAEFIKPEQLGWNRSHATTAMIIAAAAIVGFVLFMSQNPRTTEPMVVFNVFIQVLPTSIAEVMVCWALIGTSFESLGKYRMGEAASVTIGAVAASVLFGVYHYAHSPPFNQTSIVLFLMLPSIATAVTYFLGRNIYAAIIVQNFLGIVGVIGSLPNLEPFRQPMVPVYAVSAVSIAAVVVSVSVVLTRATKKIKAIRKEARRSTALDEKGDASAT